jgi:hypothetical protein
MLKLTNMVAVAVAGVMLAASLAPADAFSFRPVLGGGRVHAPRHVPGPSPASGYLNPDLPGMQWCIHPHGGNLTFYCQ